MSQYPSYLATAPVLQVLKPTSSPESIRQFGNPSQLAKPWFIFRRPSATRYTPRKEAQQLEESHDDSITSVMSFANPESVFHEDIDCIATTAAEEITAVEVPEILYEQIGTRSSTDLTIFEPSTNQELISKVSESSNAETTVAEVSKIILYEQINNRSSTDVAIFEPSPHPELTLKVSKNSGADIDYVTTAAEKITAVEAPETILYERIDTYSSTDVTILEPSTDPELIFEASGSLNADTDCVVTTAAEEITAEVPETILYEQIEIRSSTNPEVIFKVSENSNANIGYVVTTVAEEIAAAEDPEIILYEQKIGSSTDVTICSSPELIDSVSKYSSQHADPASDIAIMGQSTILELTFEVSECPAQHADSVSNTSSAETTHPRTLKNLGSGVTPVGIASRRSAGSSPLGRHRFLKGNNEAIETRSSKKLLQSKTDTTPILSRRITSVQLTAITANTSRPRSSSSLPTSPQVPQRPANKPFPPAKSAPPKKFGSSRFAGSVLHLPSADEEETRRRHALINGKLVRAPKAGMSVRPPGAGIKTIPGRAKVQERVGSNASLAVMVEEEEEEVAECNPIPAAEKVEEKVAEKVAEEKTGAVISGPVYIAPRGVETSGPFARSRNVRRKPIVWRKLDSITEEGCEEDEPAVLVARYEPAAAIQKVLEEAPIVNGEEEGGVAVEMSPEDKGEQMAEVDSGAGINPAGEAPLRPIPYPTPSRWSSRIGEMSVPRKPSYGWQTQSQTSPEAGPPEPMSAERIERVQYPAPMRWSSRIGEVKRARTLGYASLSLPATPEPLGSEVDTNLESEVLPLFFSLTEEAVIVPQEEEEEEHSSSSGELGESQGTGVGPKKTGLLRRRAKQAWKKIGRVFSGGRG